MRALKRRGFTLIELLLGLVTAGVVTAIAVTVVMSASRSAARHTRQLAIERTALSLETFLEQELRDGLDSDVTPLAPTRLALARSIGAAAPCAADDTSVVIADSAWRGTRAPQAARDDAELLVDPVVETWQAAAINRVGADRCPVSNAPATRLTLAFSSPGAVAVRIVEPIELRAYRSGAADWFGVMPANGSSPVQPFAGPLQPGRSTFAVLPGVVRSSFQASGGPAMTVSIPLAPP